MWYFFLYIPAQCMVSMVYSDPVRLYGLCRVIFNVYIFSIPLNEEKAKT
jgi:hypothetical protein